MLPPRETLIKLNLWMLFRLFKKDPCAPPLLVVGIVYMVCRRLTISAQFVFIVWGCVILNGILPPFHCLENLWKIFRQSAKNWKSWLSHIIPLNCPSPADDYQMTREFSCHPGIEWLSIGITEATQIDEQTNTKKDNKSIPIIRQLYFSHSSGIHEHEALSFLCSSSSFTATKYNNTCD